jgi:hypothetical protein
MCEIDREHELLLCVAARNKKLQVPSLEQHGIRARAMAAAAEVLV